MPITSGGTFQFDVFLSYARNPDRQTSKHVEHFLETFHRKVPASPDEAAQENRAVMLTVKGRAAAVVQDAEAYQRLLDVAARADPEEGIRQGLDDAKRRKVRPAREFFADFEATHGIPRSSDRPR